MADTTELYRGVIDEFVDWVTGKGDSNGEPGMGNHVDPDMHKISGYSIRLLLQERLLNPVYNYNEPNSTVQILFPSERIKDLWLAAGGDAVDEEDNKYNKYKIITLPKPSAYKFLFNSKITVGKTNIDIENLHTYYILKNGNSIDVDIQYSYRTVDALTETQLYVEGYSFTFYITDPNGILKSFTRKRNMATGINEYQFDSIGSYLKSGMNSVAIQMIGEGSAANPKSGLSSTVVSFNINIVSMELSLLFTNSPSYTNFNINRAITSVDENLSGNNPTIYLNYVLNKTVIGSDGVHFDIFIDADLPLTDSAFKLNHESYRNGDGSTPNEKLVNAINNNTPTFTITKNENENIIIINNDTAGDMSGADFLSNLKDSGKFSGQHSLQMYAYINIDNLKFYSNTVYFTFNIQSSDYNNLYANIYYNGNKYSSPYFTNYSDRYITCEQYQDVNISWAIYSIDSSYKVIEWDLEYDGNSGYNQKITTQRVHAFDGISNDTLMENNKGLQFVPIYADPAKLKAYCIEDDNTRKLVFSINVKINKANYTITEKTGYIFKLSAYSKANYTQDQNEWIPVNSTGNVPNISSISTEKAFTEFVNINFNSSATGWVNHGLNIFGKNSYAIIHYNALEMTELTKEKGGYTVEIEFETMRVQDDNDVLIRIGDNSGGSIVITPTKAYVASNNAPTSALTNYKINERMRLAFVFNVLTSNKTFDKEHPDNNLIYIINNGILERAALMEGTVDSYRSSSGFIQIGHKDGDEGKGSGIIVYNIKIYNTALSHFEELHNYILDATDKASIINRNRGLDMTNKTLKYEDCAAYVPTFLIEGDLTRILNKNADGKQFEKDESTSNVNITYTNPFDPTRNFTVTNALIRKHGQSTLTYPITSMKFWLNKTFNAESGVTPTLNWEYAKANYTDDKALTKNRYIMKRNSFVDDNNIFADLSGKESIPANKFVLLANYADSSGVHNGAIERLIQLTWMSAKIDDVYILRTPPQLFTTNTLNMHDYAHEIYEYWAEDDPNNPDKVIINKRLVNTINIERYTLAEAYSSIFTGPPSSVDRNTWIGTWNRIKDKNMHELINISMQDYSNLTEEQQDIIDAELCYRGYGKLHSSHGRYNEFAQEAGHVAGHLQWNDFWKPLTKKFPYHIGIAADSLPCAVFYQSNKSASGSNTDNTKQFLGQYVFMEDKKSEECFGEEGIYAGKGGTDYTDPFCFRYGASKEKNGTKQTAKRYRLWNNKRVLRIEVLNVDSIFTSFLNDEELDIPITQLSSDDKVLCKFDSVVRTPKDDKGNYTVHMCWETDFELIYPDPDDIAEDQAEVNEELHYYDEGSEFRKITQPWVDFFKWAVSTVGDEEEFIRTAPMHLDLWKIAAYYIFYLRFGLVDSVERNAQWKTYDGLHWHCEPWDMDIALGNNNQGQITYSPPMTRETKLGTDTYAFSGSGAKYGSFRGNWIWNALEAWSDWKDDIVPKVAKALTDAGLTYDNINYMFDQEYVYKWSESIYNIGGHFKYIESTSNTEGNAQSLKSDYSKLSWLQGSRETHRHWWLYESMNYYDSVWDCGDYTNKSIQIFTIKKQGVEGYANITTTRDCVIKVKHNNQLVTQINAKTGVPTGQAVSFKNLSLSTKVPMNLYGVMFFEKLDISTVSTNLARLNLSGATSAITGGTLYELNIGTPKTGTESNSIFKSFGVNKVGIENADFEHLEKYNIEGQTGLNFNTASLNNMPALKVLLARASGLTSASFKELQFTNLELPASTQSSPAGSSIVSTSIFSSISLENVTWDNLSFWTATLSGSGENKLLNCSRYGANTSFQIGNDTILLTIPITIATITFTGNTAKTTKAKDFIYRWLWGKYANVINSGHETNNEEFLRAEFASSNVTLENIEWEIGDDETTGFTADYNDTESGKTTLLTYMDLKLLSYIPQEKRRLTGYIVIGDASERPGIHAIGDNNKLTSAQMAFLQNNFGTDIFANNSILQISHVNSYISLSIITADNNGSYTQDNMVFLKESELGSSANIKINATRFGQRNDTTTFNWQALYILNNNTEYTTIGITNNQIIGDKSVLIEFTPGDTYKRNPILYARESTINTQLDPFDSTGLSYIESYPIILRCYPAGQPDNIAEISFNVLPKIFPEKIRIKEDNVNQLGAVTYYTGLNIMGIHDTATFILDVQGYFSYFTNEWYSIESDGNTIKDGRLKYRFGSSDSGSYNYLSTTGDKNSLGVITFHHLNFTMRDNSAPAGINPTTLDNTVKTENGTNIVLFSGNNKPTIEYWFDNLGKLNLSFSKLQEKIYDYTLKVDLRYGLNAENYIHNSTPLNLKTLEITLRTLQDNEVIVSASGNSLLYNRIANILSAGPLGGGLVNTDLYKMDLYLLERKSALQDYSLLDFSTSQYRAINNTLTNNGDESIFKYLPNITKLNLSSCNKLTSKIGETNNFDFTNMIALEILNMNNMTILDNTVIMDLRNCKKLLEVHSMNSNATFLYPESINTLLAISFGNPTLIVLKTLPALLSIIAPTDNNCEHLYLENLKDSTFNYFAKIYKNLRK